MNEEIKAYNQAMPADRQAICNILAQELSKGLPEAESKIWHRTAVWFLDGNPVVGYSSLKDNVQLLFWSGQDFNESGLENEGTFKAAQKRYNSPDEINTEELHSWLSKAREIQWDYKNIVKNKGVLNRLK